MDDNVKWRFSSIDVAVSSVLFFFFFSSRRRHTRCSRDWSSDVCSSDLFNVERVPVKSTWDLLNIASHEGAWTLLKLAPARPLERESGRSASRTRNL